MQPTYTSLMGMIQSQIRCTNFMDVYAVWKAQGTLDKGCSWYWIGGPTGSGKTLVAGGSVGGRREMSAFFCSRGTCNGKLHFQMQRYQRNQL